MKCKDLVNVKNLICYDKFTEEQAQFFEGKGICIVI
jgi:hypothetical protein